MGLDNLRGVLNTDMGIKDTFRFDNGDWTLFSEAMAAGEIYLDVFQSRLGYGSL